MKRVKYDYIVDLWYLENYILKIVSLQLLLVLMNNIWDVCFMYEA